MARRNRTRFTILGTLTLGPRSGYDIKRFIERSIGNFWSESYGQLYPTLRALEGEGLVEKEVGEQAGRPARHVYSITTAGRAVLGEWLKEAAEPQVPRVEVLLKLFFGAQTTTDVNLEHVRRFRERVEKSGALCSRVTDALAEETGDPNVPYWLLGLRQGVLVYRALLQWCDEAEQIIRDLDEPDV